jgi:hypothetical protein
VFAVPALTAAQVLDEALKVNAGDRLLVNGAGRVTGRLLVALGSLRGAEVIATAGPWSHEPIAALGASHVIDYRKKDWPARVLASPEAPGLPLPQTPRPAARGTRSERLPTAVAWQPSPQTRPRRSEPSWSQAFT